jgi:hypothetical protein
MARGEFQIADQIGPKGYYGKVALEAEPSEAGGEVTIQFDQTDAARWQSGAQFGIDYALEHVSTRKFFPHGGRVRVLRIEGHEVDTNNTVIAYVAAHALFRALGVEPTKRPNFDGSTGAFVFPK